MSRITATSLQRSKQDGEKIAVLTAYDHPFGMIVDEAGVDAVLVGDSCGNVVMGRRDTLSVTMDEMVHHVRMVATGVKRALVIADMPFLSYQVSPEDAVRNAGRFVTEAGAQAVKLEGPADKFGQSMRAILNTGIPLMGHIGLTPQSVHQIGGYKVQGKSAESRKRLKDEARSLEALGCFAVVLECIPWDLAAEITQMLRVPTIGIGAGAGCDGQVLVLHDILGWGSTRFTKTFADVRAIARQACTDYVNEVKSGVFPAEEHQYS